MKTSDIFKTRASKLNESMEKVFGKKLNLESFGLEELQDARNKLRTQVSQVRTESGFNENLENEAFHQAQWMLDAINAEISEREEFIADPHVAEVTEEPNFDIDDLFDQWVHSEYAPYDDDSGDFRTLFDKALMFVGDIVGDEYAEMVAEKLAAKWDGEEYGEEGGDTDDAYALASAGHGSDEDYGSFGYDEDTQQEGYTKFGAGYAEQLALKVFQENPNLSAKGRADEVLDAGWKFAVQDLGKKRAQWEFNYDEDFPSDFVSAYGWLQMGGNPETGEDGEEYTKTYGHLFKGRDEAMESAPPGDKYERMVKHIKKGYGNSGKISDREKGIAYATAWKAYNKKHKKESVETGDNMTRLTEGEIQQASAIVNAKTMVDRVGRWIEELSGMENDTLLQLGDSIRDEMSQELAKTFISAVAPAIQQALENLKQTRETLASGVRMLTGEEQGAEMIGAEPAAPETGDEMGVAEPDTMNSGDELDSLAGDEFGASDAGAGGLEAAGREKRESVEYSNKLLKVLAG